MRELFEGLVVTYVVLLGVLLGIETVRNQQEGDVVEHTPRPWHECGPNICDENGKEIAVVWGVYPGRDANETRANMRLISAAPDYDDAARQLIQRHDALAKSANFVRCGCKECAPFRTIIAKTEWRDTESRASRFRAF